MVRKILLSTLLLVGVLVVSAMVHLPAQFIVMYAPLPAPLTLTGVQGTLWQGSVQQVNWQKRNYGSLNWQLNVIKLLTGKLEAQVRFGRDSDLGVLGRGVVGVSTRGAYAQNFIASLPVEQVMQFAPTLPVPVELTGQVELSVRDYRYGEPYCDSAEGSLVWNTNKVVMPMAEIALGPVVVNFTCQQNQIDAQGEQRSDAVESGFVASLNPDSSYSTSAWFKPLAEFPGSLQQQLKWLPEQADAGGKYQFRYQGRL